MEYAQYRIIPCPVPLTPKAYGIRPCDIEVSTDGETWMPLPSANVVWDGDQIVFTLHASLSGVKL